MKIFITGGAGFIGAHANSLDCLSRIDTEWIAWVEGDDYWIDNSKLSKQMNLLEENSSATVCFSKANSVDTALIGFI